MSTAADGKARIDDSQPAAIPSLRIPGHGAVGEEPERGLSALGGGAPGVKGGVHFEL
jgi:hypothetical protein